MVVGVDQPDLRPQSILQGDLEQKFPARISAGGEVEYLQPVVLREFLKELPVEGKQAHRMAQDNDIGVPGMLHRMPDTVVHHFAIERLGRVRSPEVHVPVFGADGPGMILDDGPKRRGTERPKEKRKHRHKEREVSADKALQVTAHRQN